MKQVWLKGIWGRGNFVISSKGEKTLEETSTRNLSLHQRKAQIW